MKAFVHLVLAIVNFDINITVEVWDHFTKIWMHLPSLDTQLWVLINIAYNIERSPLAC